MAEEHLFREMKNSTDASHLVEMYGEMVESERNSEADIKATSVQAKCMHDIQGLNPHEVDLLLSRSEFVVKTGNNCSKISIEKKVQWLGECCAED